MAAKVLDSWALLAFFKDEPAASEVEKIINGAVLKNRKVFLCAVNWAEAVSAIERAGGGEIARRTASEIAQLPLQIVGTDSDMKLCRAAAKLKSRHNISLGAAFAAALAQEKRADLVTGDPQFRPLASDISIQWLDTNGTRTIVQS
jgi:PIN domain nuclease of toxin-antitoxin system